jgi:hypothetical protein
MPPVRKDGLAAKIQNRVAHFNRSDSLAQFTLNVERNPLTGLDALEPGRMAQVLIEDGSAKGGVE